MLGKTISHYKVIEELGEGGMSVVFKAQDTELDRVVALKFLVEHPTSDLSERERFYHEARAAAALTHQNVAVIYEIDEHDGQTFIALEYVEGKTLKEFVEKEKDSLSVRKALDIAIQICEGLAAAHERGIVHRDIKSDNIMLTPKGQIKIMDFGLAKLKGTTKLTKTGSTLGTAAYMSPEQARGEDVDHRSDIFSFGVVLYEMLTAHLPFRGEHQAAMLYSVVNEDPPPIARFNDKVSVELERIILKALAKDREERYQHSDDMLADLRKERKVLEYDTASTIAEKSAVQKTRKIFVSLLILTLLAIILIVFNPFKKQAEQTQSIESPTKSLAVMYFEDIPDPEDKDHTGDMLTNLLITSLSQLRGVEVISKERLLEIQKDMGQADEKSLSPSSAMRIANRAGVTTMLIGSIVQKTPKLAVTTQLVDVKSGKVTNSNQVTSFAAANIFSLVDTLSYLLKNDFFPDGSVEIKPVAEVTTKSIEAYRAYVEAFDPYEKLYFTEAAAGFKRAIELDSTFAMAYYQLSVTQMFLGEDSETLKSSEKAVEFSGKATERERLQILAWNYWQIDEPVKAAGILQQITERYPHETIPSIWELRIALKINPSAKLLWYILSYSLADLDRKQEAFDAIDKYIDLAPAEANPYDAKGDLYVMFGDYDSSCVLFQKALSFRKDFGSATKLGYYSVLRKQYNEAEEYFKMSGFPLPMVDVHRGQLHVALNKLKLLLKSHVPTEVHLTALFEMMHLYYETGQFPEMLKMSRELSIELRKYPSSRIYGRDYIAWALAKKGEPAGAHKLIDSIQSDVMGTYPRLQVKATYISALVALEEGKNELALEQFKRVFDELPPNRDPNLVYAICLLRCGRVWEAVDEFKRLVYWQPGLYHPSYNLLAGFPEVMDYWPISAVKAHYWLGVAYERLGQKTKALGEYKMFLDIWKNADFKSLELADAKARVDALEKVTVK